MIEVYGMGSPNVLKVVLALEEIGLPWSHHHVDVFRGAQFTAEFAALTPNAKVPVIVDPDGPDGKSLVLWESGAILLYLAAKTGQLLPASKRDAAIVTQWLMFQMASIGPMGGQHFHFRATPPGSSDYARSRFATEVERILDVVETRLAESDHLGGAAYSIADVAAWPWLRMLAPSGATRPHLAAWIARIAQRPAAKKTLEFLDGLPKVDFRELAKTNRDDLDRYFGRGRWARG
jgi:GST-like protein